MINETQEWKAYGEGMLSVAAQSFTQWVERIPDKVKDGYGTEQTGWIEPASFCATSNVNDARYRVGGRTPVEDRRS